ncbi:MAG: mechanosensitive ion channel family protein [Gammaproteobacteria bacterium]|nr:mechanosensitive ion channel family protein [Gammaproteobacteria bacterium]
MPQLNHLVAQFDYASLAQNALRVLLILLAAVLIWLLIRLVIARVEARIIKRSEEKGDSAGEAKRRAATLTALIRRLLFILYWLAVALTLLSQLGINIGALLAGAGVAGLALSFGAQSLVKDVISGFFMVMENQIRVGDIAAINDTRGTVESIHFRTTLLRDVDGAVHVFRNGEITKLANLTRDWSGYIFEIGVAYKEDTDKVIGIIQRVGWDMKGDPELGKNLLQDMEIFGVDQLADSAVIIKGRLKTQPSAQWAVGRAFLARVKKAFDAEGIEIPFPHRTLYFGEASPPFKISRSGGDTADERITGKQPAGKSG